MLTLDWLWFWQKPAIDFVTLLSVEECQSRLAKALDYKWGLFGFHTTHPVIGQIRGHRFYLTKTPSRLYRDDFKPFLYGKLTTHSHGTHVQASFRLSPAMTLGLVASVSIFSCLVVREALLARAPAWSLTFLVIFWGIVALLIWLGSWSNASNREVLTTYLRDTLRSNDVEH